MQIHTRVGDDSAVSEVGDDLTVSGQWVGDHRAINLIWGQNLMFCLHVLLSGGI